MFILVLININTYSVGFEYIGPFNNEFTADQTCKRLNDERGYYRDFQFVVQHMKGIEDVLEESE